MTPVPFNYSKKMFKVPKDKVVEYLHELADEGYQRRVWLASSGPEVSSFVEAVCGLFDDTGLAVDLDDARRPGVFSVEIDESLRQLRQLIAHTDISLDVMPTAAVIEHPGMREIRCMAAMILAQMEREGIS
jgi:hypothetical protein